jgi:hypothetical protein
MSAIDDDPEPPEPTPEPPEEPSDPHRGPLDNPDDEQYLRDDDPRRTRRGES